MRVLWISKASVTKAFRRKISLLPEKGIEIGVVTGPRWDQWVFESEDSDETYPIFVLNQRFAGYNHFHWYRRLNNAIVRFKPDLIHIDEEHYSLVTAQAVTLAMVHKIPAIFQSWQNIYKRYPIPFALIEQYVFRYCVAAIAGNGEVKKVLRKKGFNKQISIIGLGADLVQFFPRHTSEFRDELRLHNRWVIGFVGRLVPEKGVLDLLQAVQPILKDNPLLHCVIAGHGPLKQQVEQFINTFHLSSQISLLPWVEPQLMPQLMNAFDVLVTPSSSTDQWKEQFGRVIIEAMAVGIPVIGSNSGEIPNVIGEGGIIFPEKDVQKLRTAILTLYKNSDVYQAIARMAYDRAINCLSQDHVANQILEFYQGLPIEESLHNST